MSSTYIGTVILLLPSWCVLIPSLGTCHKWLHWQFMLIDLYSEILYYHRANEIALVSYCLIEILGFLHFLMPRKCQNEIMFSQWQTPVWKYRFNCTCSKGNLKRILCQKFFFILFKTCSNDVPIEDNRSDEANELFRNDFWISKTFQDAKTKTKNMILF